MEQEIWKNIPGFENKYQASNFGNIKSLNYRNQKGKKKILKPVLRKDGYTMIFLSNKGYLIHKLILLTFIGKSDLESNHKNGIKIDNRLENIEYCTRSQNVKHAYDTGLKKAKPSRGEKNGMARLTENDVIEIRKAKDVVPGKDLAIKFNTTKKHIYAIWQNREWKHVII